MVDNIKKYFFEKMIFPKRFIINKPGAIINRLGGRFNFSNNQMRSIFYFEDSIVFLQNETEKILNKTENYELWYNIGRDTMIRYILLGIKKRPPKFMINTVLQNIFLGFCTSGFTATRDFFYDPEKRVIILKGRDNIVCRKSKIPAQFCGGISALVSFLLNDSFYASTECNNCPCECKIIAKKIPGSGFNPNMEDMEIERDYSRLNFQENSESLGVFNSFSDLMKFKKLKFDQDEKYSFMNHAVLATNSDLFGLIVYNFKKIGKYDFLKKTIPLISRKITDELLLDQTNIESKLSIVKNIISAFGLGIFYFERSENSIIIRLKNPPITKFGFDYHAFEIQGILESVFNNNLKLDKIETIKKPVVIKLYYTLVQ